MTGTSQGTLRELDTLTNLRGASVRFRLDVWPHACVSSIFSFADLFFIVFPLFSVIPQIRSPGIDLQELQHHGLQVAFLLSL
jgi:hypothetical protein